MPWQPVRWAAPRRLVVVRELPRERANATGRGLFDLRGDTVHAVVTNLSPAPEEIWRFYNGRADCESRIKELKLDFAADGYCLRSCQGTEASLQPDCPLFNFLTAFKDEVLTPPPLQPSPPSAISNLSLVDSLAPPRGAPGSPATCSTRRPDTGSPSFSCASRLPPQLWRTCIWSSRHPGASTPQSRRFPRQLPSRPGLSWGLPADERTAAQVSRLRSHCPCARIRTDCSVFDNSRGLTNPRQQE